MRRGRHDRRQRHSALSVVFLCVIILSFALIMMSPYTIHAYSIDDDYLRVFHLLAAIFLCALSLIMYFAVHATAYRTCLALFFCVSFIFTVSFERHISSYGLLMAIGILSIILYESYPLNLFFSLILVAGLATPFAIRLSSSSYELWEVIIGASTSAIVGTLLSIIGSYLTKARSELVIQLEVNEQLAENVVKLTQANVTSLSLVASVEENSRTSERQRLAREIHDLVGYTLTTNITLMEAVKLMAKTEPNKIPEYVETIRRNSEKALEEIRAVLRNLHSEAENIDLLNLIVKLKNVFSYSTGVKVNYEYGNVAFRSLERYRDVIYHFLQEALINAFRHGKATSATVFFWQDSHTVAITVEDDGIGALGIEEDIGITGMRERALRVHGSIIIPNVQVGFKIVLTLPANGEN